MSDLTLRNILSQIDALEPADRLLLEQTLGERSEAEWLREAGAARELARQRGVDQNTIDHAIHDLRYGDERSS